MSANEPTVRLRAALQDVPAYKAGKSAAVREDLVTYKISSNENPYPPLPSVTKVVAEAADNIHRYPDPAAQELVAALAQRWGVSTEEIATGTGSVGVLETLVQVTCEPGDEIVYAWRSFEAYPIVAALAGARSVQVPVDGDARHDLTAMAEAITDRTRLVIVCTPNNPTGPSVTEAELRRFLDRVRPDLLVVLDEAYLEFVRADDAPDALAIYRNYPNVAVLRTFSKAYGLAGLRVGYCTARPQVAEALRTAATPFGVSGIAQRAAVASIDAYAELADRVEALVAERTRVIDGLRAQGWSIPDSQANFVWLPLGADALPFAAAADQAGLVVRPFDGDGVRATIAEVEANDRLLQVCQDWIATH